MKSPALEIYLFGTPEIRMGGKTLLRLPTRKSVLLLAHLIMKRTRPVDRNVLAFELWPDLSEERARGNLNTEIWRLRKSLQTIIATDAKSVWFSPETDSLVDVEMFEMDLGGASIAQMEKAISYYRGDFLEGFYEDWVLIQREHYRDRLLQYMDRCAGYYQSAAEPRRAISFVKQILDYNPVHEESCQRLMFLYARIGEYASAIQQYQQFAELLERELGLSPLSETNVLYQQILKQSQENAGQPRPLVQPEKAFVGRATAMDALNNTRSVIMHEQKVSVTIMGEAGIGKTRLVEHWLSGLLGRAVILRGHCYEAGKSIPYLPIKELFRTAVTEYGVASLHKTPAALANAITILLPELQSHLPGNNDPGFELPPAEARDHFMEMLSSALLLWSVPEKPLILFLDDLQWADDESFDFLIKLLGNDAVYPILLVCTYRPDALALVDSRQAYARINKLGSRKLYLDSLSKLEIGELIRKIGNLSDLPEQFTDLIHVETEGNPLFVIETLRGLFDSGFLSANADGVWAIPLNRQLADLKRMPMTATLRDVIRKRVERLSPDQYELLCVAAVVGGEFEAETLWSVSGMTETKFRDAMTTLLEGGLIQELPAELHYGFSHVKIQESLLEDMTDWKRAEAHLKMTRFLESSGDGQNIQYFERLAYHYSKAGESERALEYLEQAGDEAMKMYAYKTAASDFEKAVSLFESHQSGERKFQLLMKLYQCKWSTELDHSELGEVLEKARQIAEQTAKADLLARAYFHSGVNFISRGIWDKGHELLQKSLEYASAGRMPEIEMRAHMEIANILQYKHRRHESIPQIKAVLKLSRQLKDIRMEGRASWDLAELSTGLKHQAVIGKKILDRAMKTNTLSLVIDLGSSIIMVLLRVGDPGGALESGQRILDYARLYNATSLIRSVQRALSYTYCFIGEYAIAKTLANESLISSRQAGYRYGEMRALTCLALSNAGFGLFEDALAGLKHAADLSEQIGSKMDLVAIRLEIISLLIHRADPSFLPAAEELARQVFMDLSGEDPHRGEVFALSYLSQILAMRKETEEAVRLSEKALRLMKESKFINMVEEPEIYYNHFKLLDHIGNDSGRHALERARAILYCRALTLPARFRRSYLGRVPLHHEISKLRLPTKF